MDICCDGYIKCVIECIFVSLQFLWLLIVTLLIVTFPRYLLFFDLIAVGICNIFNSRENIIMSLTFLYITHYE